MQVVTVSAHVDYSKYISELILESAIRIYLSKNTMYQITVQKG
jgi:hypothetical protein